MNQTENKEEANRNTIKKASLKIFKAIIYTILCNRFTGWLILTVFKKHIPDIRSKNYSFVVSNPSAQRKTIASIFFGFYERGETRFINKYLNPNLDVIELGCSLGIVSSHLIHKLQNGSQLILIEPNPYLQQTIKENVSKHNPNNIRFQLLNYAVGYGSKNVRLNITNDSTASKIVNDDFNVGKSIMVETISLNSVVNKFKLSDYALVCDIEGSEIEWILNEGESLKNCRQLLIELHAVNYGRHYTVNEIKDIIVQKHNFKLVDWKGPVCYFEK